MFASKLYIMIAGVDILIVLLSIINIIIDKFGIKQLPTIVCTNFFSLYECIVKLGTTKEKRLIIDIILIC